MGLRDESSGVGVVVRVSSQLAASLSSVWVAAIEAELVYNPCFNDFDLRCQGQWWHKDMIIGIYFRIVDFSACTKLQPSKASKSR